MPPVICERDLRLFCKISSGFFSVSSILPFMPLKLLTESANGNYSKLIFGQCQVCCPDSNISKAINYRLSLRWANYDFYVCVRMLG